MRIAVAVALAGCLAFAAAGAQEPDTAATQPRRRVRVFGYPYAFYSPETDFAFGVGGIVSFHAGRDTALRPSKVLLSAYYTANRQYKMTLSHDLFAAANRTAGGLDASFGRFIDKFYGTGPASPDTGKPDYLLELLALDASLTRMVSQAHGLQAGAVVRVHRQANIDKRDNGFLLGDSVTGSGGGWVTGLGLDLVRDTRDNVFYPTHGVYSELRAVTYTTALGGDFEFTEIVADLRGYRTLGSGQVLGLQLYGAFSGGDPPYFKLPKLGGGSRMRGYYEGRYRDRHYVMGQAEYRTRLFGRFGGVLFAGVGTVGPTVNKLSLGNLHAGYGFGLRYLFDRQEHINVRADVGFGPGTSGVYFSIEEAF